MSYLLGYDGTRNCILPNVFASYRTVLQYLPHLTAQCRILPLAGGGRGVLHYKVFALKSECSLSCCLFSCFKRESSVVFLYE